MYAVAISYRNTMAHVPIHPECNYIELVLSKSARDPPFVHFEAREMQDMINRFAAAHEGVKANRRQYSITVLPTMVLYYYPQEDTSKAYHMKLLEHRELDGYLCNMYHNVSLPLFGVPSNRDDVDHMEVSRTSFKLDKSVFVNFEAIHHEDDTLFNHVYANINAPDPQTLALAESVIAQIRSR